MAFSPDVTFSFSKDTDYLPSNAIIVDKSPCANLNFQVTSNAYTTEVQQKETCPGDMKSQTYLEAGLAWSTTEEAVKQENLVAGWLATMPVYALVSN